jgi:hypothetical protein
MKRFLLMMMLAATLLGGCYPEGPEYTEDLDVVYTTYDVDYDFQAGSTYAMPDKIVVDAERDGGGNWVPEYMPQGIAEDILEEIEANMTANGWTRLPNIGSYPDGLPDENADVFLTPAAMKSTTYFYSYWYDWWYGGWGWYYPPYVTVSSYTTGSMIMTIADPNIDQLPINQSEAVWVSVGNGIFTGSYDLNRVKKSIAQSFEQSPYLKTN